MSLALVVDTSALLAVLDRDEPMHESTVALIDGWPGVLTVPQLTLSEVDHFLGRRGLHSAQLALLRVLAMGEVQAQAVAMADWQRMAELGHRYADLHLGLVDTSVMACAERLGTLHIATLDHRHFRAVVPDHGEHFVLHPADREWAA